MITGRSSSGSRVAAIAVALTVVAVATTRAHRRDEYLQAARLAVDPDRVRLELALVPGMSIVDRVLPEIDVNGDGLIGSAEARTYSQKLVSGLILEVDRRPIHLVMTDVQVSPLPSMRQGEGAISITAVAALPNLDTGDHRLHYRNTHRSDISAYLANALVPTSDHVTITSQERDVRQQDLVIAYRLNAALPARQVSWTATALGGVALLALVLTVWLSARIWRV
jgi:hypothetical protein